MQLCNLPKCSLNLIILNKPCKILELESYQIHEESFFFKQIEKKSKTTKLNIGIGYGLKVEHIADPY